MRWKSPLLRLIPMMCALPFMAMVACNDDDAAPIAVVTPNPNSGNATVGNTGGQVTITSGQLAGAAVKVPAGAVAPGSNVTITIQNGISLTPTNGESAVGPAIVLGPENTTFLQPVQVVVPYNVGLLGDAALSELVVLQRKSDGTVLSLTPTQRDVPPGTLTVEVTSFSGFQAFRPPPNLAPVVVNDNATTETNQAITINVLANDSDPEQGVLTINSVGTPTKGVATILDGQVRYIPNLGAFGNDSFTYSVRDPQGATTSGLVSVTISEGLESVGISPLAVGAGEAVNLSIKLGTSLAASAGSINLTNIGGAASAALTNGGNGNWSLNTTVATTVLPGTYGLPFTFTITGGTPISGVGFVTVEGASTSEFALTVLHNNDGESQLVDVGGDLSQFGGAARYVTRINMLREQANSGGRNVVTLSSGDNFLAGPEFNSGLQRGVPFYDSMALSAIDYDAICIGNHDFDFGPDVLADFIRGFSDYAPFLSANLDFSAEPKLQELVDNGRIAPWTVVMRDGERIGIVGATTPQIPFISSPRNVTVDADVLGVVQNAVNHLEMMGVNKIILISHLQNINEDRALAAQLRGVDIMIAGGGDELLANTGDVLIPGDSPNPSLPYPVVESDAQGNSVYVVTTPGEYRYVGQLNVTFNHMGEVVRLDSGSGPKRVAGLQYADGVAEDFIVRELVVRPLQEALDALANNVIAELQVPLDGRRSAVRTREANEGNLIADALLWQGQQLADAFSITAPNVSIQNGGGIRNNTLLSPGNYTELATFDAAPFANFVSVVQGLTPAQFKLVLENCVSGWPGENGRFGQVSGFRMVFDGFATPMVIDDVTGQITQQGSRIIEVQLDDGTFIVQNGQPVGSTLIHVATNDFSARGGDEYPFFIYDAQGNRQADSNLPFTTLGVTYQQALFNFITSSEGLDGVISATDYPETGEGRIQLQLTAPMIHSIQGTGHTSPYVGAQVSGVEGVITMVDIEHSFFDENDQNSTGTAIYVQTLPGEEDTDDRTSEGIEIYFATDAEATSYLVGDRVTISGTVQEWIQYSFGSDTGASTVTRIGGAGFSMVKNGTSALPTPVRLGAGGRSIPKAVIDDDGLTSFDIVNDGFDFWESIEGMYVEFNDAVAVAGTTNSETPCIIDNGTHTNNTLSPKGTILIDDLAGDFNPELVIVELARLNTSDGSQFIDVKVGGKFAGLLRGVATHTWGTYRVKVRASEMSAALDTSNQANEDAEITTLVGDNDSITVASFNIENYRYSTSTSANTKRAEMVNTIVNQLREPDVIALQEVQSTSSSTTDASVSMANLINDINANANSMSDYEYVDVQPASNDADGGAPGGGIRVGFLFNRNTVSLVPGTIGMGGPLDATQPQVVNGKLNFTYNPGRIDPTNAVWNETESLGYKNSRKSIIGLFEQLSTGYRVVVLNNHLGSKSEDGGLYSRFQPPQLVTEPQRIATAEFINTYVSSILTTAPGSVVVNIGDMNEFPTRPAMTAMAGTNQVNLLLADRPGTSTPFVDPMERYTYTFNGNAQVLDNVFITADDLDLVDGVEILHVNTLREDFRIGSDHDPLIVKLRLGEVVLNPGDLAIIGYRADAPDGFALVPFRDLPGDMVLTFTDNGWTAAGALTTNENTMTWTTPSAGVPAGTVVTFSNPSGSVTTASLGSAVSALNGLSSSGDCIFCYQGEGTNPRFVFGLDMGGSAGWDAEVTSTNTSALPSVLNVTGGNVAVAHSDNGQYVGPRSAASWAELKALVTDPANWSFDDGGTVITSFDTTAFTLAQ